MIAVLEDAATRHPEWSVRIHEQLCVDPITEFQRLYGELGLPWGQSSEDFLRTHNAPGSGFTVHRIASEVSDSWRSRLDDSQLRTLRRVLGRFPISTWTDQDFER